MQRFVEMFRKIFSTIALPFSEEIRYARWMRIVYMDMGEDLEKRPSPWVHEYVIPKIYAYRFRRNIIRKIIGCVVNTITDRFFFKGLLFGFGMGFGFYVFKALYVSIF